MLTCREFTALHAADELRAAPWRTRLSAWIHLAMCGSCRRYVKELRAIGQAVRRLARSHPEDPARIEALVRAALATVGPRDR